MVVRKKTCEVRSVRRGRERMRKRCYSGKRAPSASLPISVWRMPHPLPLCEWNGPISTPHSYKWSQPSLKGQPLLVHRTSWKDIFLQNYRLKIGKYDIYVTNPVCPINFGIFIFLTNHDAESFSWLGGQQTTVLWGEVSFVSTSAGAVTSDVFLDTTSSDTLKVTKVPE